MGMFDQPFKTDIQTELKYRKKFRNVQTVLHPHVRVTSLIEGNLNVPPFDTGSGAFRGDLRGFTLGVPDVNQVNEIGNYLNVSGRDGTAIGVTYHGDKAQVVKIGTGAKKLPPPGVTDVNISTQSKGGFIFKATVNLKFFGHQQYNFIYQTFLRPGTPILIEYGHTRQASGTENAGSSNKDLGFFPALTPARLHEYKDNFRNNKPLKTTRNSGAVVGLVSNFSVRLNEQNEYEATIELINALEFLFTMNPTDTFLDYARDGKNHLSKSIQANFGIGIDDEWEPEHDAFFKFIIEDAYMGHEGATGTGESVDYGKRVILPGEWTEEYGGIGGQRELGKEVFSGQGGLENTLTYSAEWSDNLYVSLDYFLNKLLNKIINASYVEEEGGGIMSGQFVSGDPDSHYQRVALNQTRKVVLPPVATRKYPIKDLRSIDHKKVIINNENFYHRVTHTEEQTQGITDQTESVGTMSNYFHTLRGNSYGKKYKRGDLPKLFGIHYAWRLKEQYTPSSAIKGIFLNYLVIRSAFLSSKSIAEAIQRVLTTVNTATVDILQLKMKLLPKDLDVAGGETGTSQEFRISIYDEADIVDDDVRAQLGDNLYTFFKEDVSEAISYDFDFSLPSSVAAGVMASTWNPSEHKAAGGQPKEKAFIDYGYALKSTHPPVLAITSLLENLEPLPLVEIDPSPPIPISEGKDVEDLSADEARKAEAAMQHAEEKKFELWKARKTTGGTGGGYSTSPEYLHVTQNQVAAKAGAPVNELIRVMDSGIIYYSNDQIAVEPVYDNNDPPNILYNEYYNFDGSQREDWSSQGTIRQQQAAWEEANADAIREAEENLSLVGIKDEEENMLFRQILGYKELIPPAMKSSAISSGLYNVIPSSAKITIKLQGLDGFRFGDLFSVNNILPHPYDDNSIFMLTGYEHTISSEGWFTEIGATLIASAPPGRTNWSNPDWYVAAKGLDESEGEL